ncbi:SDR family oxidoreductase [Lentzea flaviverrucosa]|uniref:NADP-dependent 3-hydroxy acid dehydrogenase YdfG n=1 Tax=Lentzea flaviverrucosa TaxID=200379 RepID=A0A1H9Q9C2_9PSEU|nr:SDR family oxidoreductase [Lentzea flaviverrucosa]RDI29603.1 NADP-dependent 3-hydroxy acid dehydrogenase YdfG [Lentzea flaviverrucosa]SER56453.1 NADP-dependent 3-hydroxy acid dehydrogenase YdfG [Lentzea flaviverrucosa]
MSDRPVALVTGASSGIGSAIARSLASTHDLLLGGRDETSLSLLAAELPGAQAWPFDLTNAASADLAAVSRLDVIVHSAGIALLGPLAEATQDDWRRTFDVNVFAVAELTNLVLPQLRAASGHVVLINSGAGLNANPGWGVYAASKFALRAYADALRGDEPSLRVTTVYPGRTATPMQEDVRRHEGGEYDPSKYIDPASVGRAVASAVLATPDAHITEINVRSRPH